MLHVGGSTDPRHPATDACLTNSCVKVLSCSCAAVSSTLAYLVGGTADAGHLATGCL